VNCEKITLESGQTRWVCREDAPPNPVTGKRRPIERRGKTKKEAKKKVEDIIDYLKNNGVDRRASASINFKSLAEKWLTVYEATGVKRGSVRIREKEVNILCSYLGEINTIKITHEMYQNMLLDLDKKGYARNSIKGVNTCANMIFNYAIRNKYMEYNPREGATVPKKSITVEDLEKDKIEETYFEGNELDLFLDAVLKIGLDLDKERFYTLAFTGMRPGELIALKKDDLDFEENTIRISKTLYNENNNMKEYNIDTTKTNKARTINVDEKIMSMLKKLIHKNDKYKMKYRTQVEDFHDEDFVFQRYNGYPFITKNLATRMKRILKYIKVEKNLTPHSFRHTHISMLTESGSELPTIMKKVGHEDPNTTLKIYTHVTEKMKIKSVQKLTDLHSDLINKI